MKHYLIVYLLVLSCVTRAQPPSRFFTSFGGDGDDIAYSGKPTLDRNYILTGSSSSYGTHGNTDVYLVKVDSMGFPMWQKFIGAEGNEVGKSVIQLQDSGFVVAGFTNSYGAGGYDAFVLRTDKKGELLWQRTFGGPDWDFANDLVLGPDGNIFVVGYVTDLGNGKRDGFVIKYDLSGNELLHKYIGGAENEELRAIITTHDNYLATVGYTESYGEINGDGYFLKLDLNADTLFTKRFGGPYRDYACDLVQKTSLENYDYMISGARTYTSQTSNTQSYIYWMSETGNFLSDIAYTRNAGDEDFVSVANSYQISYLSAFVRTVTMPVVKKQSEIFVTYPVGMPYKINDQGGLEDDYAYSVEGTKDGGYLIVGSTQSFKNIGYDIFLVKHDSTCFNYISVVGLNEIPRNTEKIKLLHRENKQVYVIFNDPALPESVSLFDLAGKLVAEQDISSNRELLNFGNLSSTVYLARFNYKGQQYVYRKLILSD